MTIPRFSAADTPIENGVTLIDSSAGTGKTYAISTLIPRLLLEGVAADLSRLLVVTFTNAAADELAGRIRLRLRQTLAAFDHPQAPDADPALAALVARHPGKRAVIYDALLRADEAAVYTIHSFCKRSLEEAAFESGIPLECEFIQDEQQLLRQGALDFWRQRIYHDRLLAGYVLAQGASPEGWLKEYLLCRNHEGCVLLPQAEPLPAALDSLRAALAHFQTQWEPQRMLQMLQELPKLSSDKKKPAAQVLAEPSTLVDRMNQAIMTGTITELLELIPFLSADVMRNAIKMKKEAERWQPPQICAAAQEVADSVAALRHPLRIEFFATLSVALEKEKERLNVQSFHDLLRRLADRLRDPEAGTPLLRTLRARYQAVLIDEFQDTDPLQLDIFTRIFSRSHPLFFIGDPKQAIYSFRGADIFAYLQAARDASRRFTLDQNWRSESGVVEAVNRLFSLVPAPFVFDELHFQPALANGKDEAHRLYDPAAKSCHWLTLPAPEEKATHSKERAEELALRALQHEIARMLGGAAKVGGRPVRPGDLAVLVRKNRQAQAVQNALRQIGVPAVIGGCGNILDSHEFRTLELLLIFIARREATAALAGDLWGMNAAESFAIKNDPAAWAEVCREAAELRRIWEDRGVAQMLGLVFQRRGAVTRLLNAPGGARSLTNYRHALELVQRGPAAPEALLQWLERQRGEADNEENYLRLETDAEAVQVVTIHRSKGLEYGVVFCPFLWDISANRASGPVLAHTEAGVVCDFGSDDYAQHQQLAGKEKLSEDLRLLYVALTRAVHRVVVVWGAVNQGDKSALGWLLAQSGGERQLLAQNDDSFSEHQLTTEMLASPPLAIRAVLSFDPDVTQSGVVRTFPQNRALHDWNTASFSALTYTAHRAQPHAQMEEPVIAPEVAATEPPVWFREMAGFGRGTVAPPANETGTCLHEIMESLPLRAAGHSVEEQGQIAQILSDFALSASAAHRDVSTPVQTVAGLLGRLARSPLPGAGFCLEEAKQTIHELPFNLPLRDAAPLDHALGAYFSDEPDYLPLIRELPLPALRGYLTGIIDLVFSHGGKWYIIDWKSNYLGDTPAHYHPPRLRAEMCRSHYILQYTLYALALRRYLALRLPGFDPARDFGGVYYAFLRGIDGVGGGWFHHCPTSERLKSLDQAILAEPKSPRLR